MISQLRILVPLCVLLPTAAGAHTYSRRPRSSCPPPSPGGAAGRLWRKAFAAATCHVGGPRPGRPLCKFKYLKKKKGMRPAKTPPPDGCQGHRRHRLEARRWGRRFALAPGPAPRWWAGLRKPRPASGSLTYLLSSGGDPEHHRDGLYSDVGLEGPTLPWAWLQGSSTSERPSKN